MEKLLFLEVSFHAHHWFNRKPFLQVQNGDLSRLEVSFVPGE